MNTANEDLKIGAEIMRLNEHAHLGLPEIADHLGKSVSWVATRKAFFEAAQGGDPLVRDAIASGRIPSAGALVELQVLDREVQDLLLRSNMPGLDARLCRAALALQGDYLAERMSGEKLLAFLTVTMADRPPGYAEADRQPGYAEANKPQHLEIISHGCILVEFDADLLRKLLEKTGYDNVPDDVTVMAEMFMDWAQDWVKATAH